MLPFCSSSEPRIWWSVVGSVSIPPSEWEQWHEGYSPGSQLTLRLAEVQRLLRVTLDAQPAGAIRLLSMCAGDGRDVLGVLSDHPRRDDVTALLVELDPQLAGRASQRADGLGLHKVTVRIDDAARTAVYGHIVPANVLMVCGVFGNITDDDVRRTIAHLPQLAAPGATVIWTRGTFEPDLTPTIRRWFDEEGFAEDAFTRIPDTTASVGMHTLRRKPAAFDPLIRLFSFLERSQRPSQRAQR
jgi:hypothetical protein